MKDRQDKNDTQILVCCHKKDYWREEEGFLPIQVGKAISSIDLGIVGDNSGDNISNLNPFFCELTALYWLWKNGSKHKYVGLNHYRRYFDFSKRFAYGSSCNFITEEDIKKRKSILPDLGSIFKKYDIVVPTATQYPFSLMDDYFYNHIKEDYNILKRTVKQLYPEYMDTFHKVMERNSKLRPFNMFITSQEIFDSYSQWLFNILFEVQKKVKISGYAQQARVFGFMAERLLNVYLAHNKLRIKEVPVMMVTNTPNKPVHNIVRYIRNKILSILYLLGKDKGIDFYYE